MPKLSIIVSAYNVAPWLRHCVDSILAQTFTDFELILVYDGSTDNTSLTFLIYPYVTCVNSFFRGNI